MLFNRGVAIDWALLLGALMLVAVTYVSPVEDVSR